MAAAYVKEVKLLMDAARRDRVATVHTLLARDDEEALNHRKRAGIPPLRAATNAAGLTPLHMAAQNGHVGAVQELLDGGVPFAADRCGDTPLHAAVNASTTAVVAVFARAAANGAIPRDAFLHRNHNGHTILHLAAKRGHYPLVAYLLHDCASIMVPSALDAGRSGMTPTHLAAENNHVRVLQLLVESEPTGLAARAGPQGLLPLHVAAKFGALYTMEALLMLHHTFAAAAARATADPLHADVLASAAAGGGGGGGTGTGLLPIPASPPFGLPPASPTRGGHPDPPGPAEGGWWRQ